MILRFISFQLSLRPHKSSPHISSLTSAIPRAKNATARGSWPKPTSASRRTSSTSRMSVGTPRADLICPAKTKRCGPSWRKPECRRTSWRTGERATSSTISFSQTTSRKLFERKRGPNQRHHRCHQPDIRFVSLTKSLESMLTDFQFQNGDKQAHRVAPPPPPPPKDFTERERPQRERQPAPPLPISTPPVRTTPSRPPPMLQQPSTNIPPPPPPPMMVKTNFFVVRNCETDFVIVFSLRRLQPQRQLLWTRRNPRDHDCQSFQTFAVRWWIASGRARNWRRSMHHRHHRTKATTRAAICCRRFAVELNCDRSVIGRRPIDPVATVRERTHSPMLWGELSNWGKRQSTADRRRPSQTTSSRMPTTGRTRKFKFEGRTEANCMTSMNSNRNSHTSSWFNKLESDKRLIKSYYQVGWAQFRIQKMLEKTRWKLISINIFIMQLHGAGNIIFLSF